MESLVKKVRSFLERTNAAEVSSSLNEVLDSYLTDEEKDKLQVANNVSLCFGIVSFFYEIESLYVAKIELLNKKE